MRATPFRVFIPGFSPFNVGDLGGKDGFWGFIRRADVSFLRLSGVYGVSVVALW